MFPPRPTGIRYSVVEPALLLVAYLAALVGPIAYTRYDGGVACLWIATAVLGSYLVDLPLRRWAPVLIAAAMVSAAVTATMGLGPVAALPLSIVNVAEAAAIALALRAGRRDEQSTLASIDQVAVLVLAGGTICLATAIPGGWVAAAVTGTDFPTNVVNWFAGHALGLITFAPIMMLVLRGDARDWFEEMNVAERIEAAFMLMVVTVTAWACFSQLSLPLLFLPLLPVMMATFRIGRMGAAVSIVLLAAIATWQTLHGDGPIASIDASRTFHVQYLQFYLAAVVLTVLPAAADLRRRKEVLDRLAESEARYKLISENATDVIMRIDHMGRILYISPSVEEFDGHYRADELIGTDSIELIHVDERRAVRRACMDAIERRGETQVIEHRGLPRAGGIWLESRVRAASGDQGELVVAIRDISARKTAEAELKRAAMTDPLTGLANRRAFNDAIDALVETAPVTRRDAGCVAIFDIDHFKHINDRYGHDAGDQVLERFAELARSVTRATDHVARLGGEEFGLLLPGANEALADMVCRRLMSEFEQCEIWIGHVAVRATVSAGVVRIAAGRDRRALLCAADAALYDAKNGGRNRLVLAA
ncbi:diguanylate cyclase [Sphingomonas sp.]